MNIVLFGFMGTGKSAIAKKLALRLNKDVIEMDALIEKQTNMSINQIFAEKGEAYFRELERNLVKELSRQENKIISTGGGVILDENNILNFKKNGLLFSLLATPEVIYHRVKNETHRPLLKTNNPLQTIADLLKSRKHLYEKAPNLIDTSYLTIDEVVDKILKIIENNHLTQS